MARKGKNLSDNDKVVICSRLLARSIDGRLPHGALAQVAADFGRLPTTVSKLWRKYKQGLNDGNPLEAFLRQVHVDEKWFYLTKINHRIYLVPGEVGPTRQVQSKRFIPKVMFLAAVAEPRKNEKNGGIF